MPPTKRVAKRVAPPTRDLDERDIDDDDDETPAPAATNGDAGPTPRDKKLPKGWTGGQKTMDSTSSYAQSFQPDENITVIKFLEDSPYASFRRHWVRSTNEQGQVKNRAYTCPMSFDDPCPLCEAGDKPQAVSAFNIAIVGDDSEVIRKSWDVGVRIFNVLKGYANDPKVAPLTKGFFLVNKTGKRQNVQYNVSPVRATSLREDYDIDPPEQDVFDVQPRYDESIIQVEKRSRLKEIALTLTDDEYDDD